MLIFRGTTALVQHLVSSLFLGDCSDHRLRQSSRNLCTEQSPKESDDTSCCSNTIVPLKMNIIVEENVEENNKCIKIKNLSIKLVKKTTMREKMIYEDTSLIGYDAVYIGRA